jgi:nucleotide-binding universal stress UspA family protein
MLVTSLVAARPRTLLVVVEFRQARDRKDEALRLALRWSIALRAELAACFVVSTGATPTVEERAAAIAGALLGCDAALGSESGPSELRELVVRCGGDPTDAVSAAADACRADTVVVGAAPRRLGTAAAALLDKGGRSTLVARPSHRGGPVLVACDLSAASIAAVTVGSSVARCVGAPLVVLHAADGAATSCDARDVLADLAPRADLRLCDGPPSEEIMRAERVLHPSLVVVGARGHSGLRDRAGTGRVARATARGACGPVLVVHGRWAGRRRCVRSCEDR